MKPVGANSLRLATAWAVVAAGCAPAAVPAGEAGGGRGGAPGRQSSIDEVVASELNRTFTPGAVVAVVMGDSIAFLETYGHTDQSRSVLLGEDALFHAAAAMPLVTGLLAAELDAAGVLALRDPLTKHVPGLPAGIGNAQIAHLLTHTAGLTARPSLPSAAGADDLAGAARRITRHDRLTDPGAVYSVSASGLPLAALAMERAAGTPYRALVADRILAPLDMHSSTVDFDAAQDRLTPGFGMSRSADGPSVPVSPAAESALAVPHAGLYATTADLARLAAAVLNGGRIGGEQRLPAGAVAEVLRPWIPIPGTVGGAAGLAVSLSTWEGLTQLTLSGSGRGHAVIMRLLPGPRIGVIVAANSETGALGRVPEFVLRRVLGREEAGRPARAAPTPEPTPPGPDEAARLAGRYANGGELIELVTEGGALRLRSGDLVLDVVRVGEAYRAVIADGRPALTFRILEDLRGRPYLFTGGRALVRLPEGEGP